jgi:hypothetical protein
MKQHEVEQRAVHELKAVICDKCGKVMKCIEGGCFPGVELTADAGYGSKFDSGLQDPKTYDLCDECWGGIVGWFEVIKDE